MRQTKPNQLDPLVFFGSQENLDRFRDAIFARWSEMSAEEIESEIPHFSGIIREKFPEKFIEYDAKKAAEKLEKERLKALEKMPEKIKDFVPVQLSLFD